MFVIKTYQTDKPMKADFYIQSKGLHAGRPLKEPIANCFAVTSENKTLFELVYALYIAKEFEYFIIGSVIPFIRIGDVESLIKDNAPKANIKILLALEKLDELVLNAQQKLNLTINMRKAYALEAFKTVN